MVLVKNVRSQCNVWYMDDGTLGDSVDTLLTNFRMLFDGSTRLDLGVNVTKCEIIRDDVKTGQRSAKV
jgi:hypothetical protein